jgi:hypothetical protein
MGGRTGKKLAFGATATPAENGQTPQQLVTQGANNAQATTPTQAAQVTTTTNQQG